MNFHTANGSIVESTHLAGHCPREDALVAAISSGLALREGHRSVYFTGDQEEDFLYGDYKLGLRLSHPPTNLWAMEVTLPAKDQATPKVMLEVEFISQASTSSDAVPLIGMQFDEALAKHSAHFHEEFQRKFPHNPSVVSEEEVRSVN